MEEVVQYELLLPYQFEARMAAYPLAFVPVGALEWHSEHMALGNDTHMAHAMCWEAARLGGGIVFPGLYYQSLEGVYGKDPRRFASRELGRQALQAVARDLAALGQRLLDEVG